MSNSIVIYKDDEVIGYVEDIRADALHQFNEYGCYEEGIMLIQTLKNYNCDDLVRCWYHPMGSWRITRLEEVH